MRSTEVYVPTGFQAETHREVERLDALLPSDTFSPDVRQSLYRFALIRNSWGTTNIDAGPIDLGRVEDLYEAWKRGVTRSGTILPSEREVLNYFALVEDVPRDSFPLSLDDVREVHRQYFHDVPLQNDARPGHWKEANNVVLSPWGRLQTTPKEHVERDLQALLDWTNGPAQTLPVVVRTAIFFHRFQRIHPFGDGNGRVGRFLALTLLSIGGLNAIRYCPVDDAINEDREEYYRALAAGDAGDLETWVNYFQAQIRTGYQRAHHVAERLQLVPLKFDRESRRLLEWLYVHRVQAFRFKEAKDFYLDASERTVRRRLQDLEESGLLRRDGKGAGSTYRVTTLHDARTRA